MREEDIKNNEIFESLKILAPGTPLREGLENIVRAKTGALIVVGDSDEVLSIVDGGFNINSDFTPANLYELAKMDGAIIISHDVKKILYANAQLMPDPFISSKETGIRHRTAERVAKQTNELVISISQRRNIITLYKGNHKYVLKDVSEILSKANQAIQTLEKYKSVLDQTMANLSALEFENLVTVYDVAIVLQRTEMVMRIVKEIDKYILELGNEGRLISMQLEELMGDVEEDGINIIKDYITEGLDFEEVKKSINSLTSEDLLDLTNIANILGFDGGINSLDINIFPKGYRILSKIPRLPYNVLENVIEMFGSFQEILRASISDLDKVEGIGEVRARAIKEGLRRVQEQSLLDRHI
ncbi:DNA integrity scanning protein DisA [Caloranaerobacter azorensis H53214]|uniref:diadenylate cyclase n=2 Tax=Caloranaerobacter azorensis TaxID=116090 RepID=A0A1M5VJC0_9FIRM|nr:DNA integrity scanning diadenylate cyclase DisA [Caloranaerobacter azorensis]KGG80113.1 DNA integrity scanning protein DisA [Caloranaerobacter azorensis H53214]SHH75382.1 diadenylate cyclase [Caloranaerobacter azorensis DSM 13643]